LELKMILMSWSFELVKHLVVFHGHL